MATEKWTIKTELGSSDTQFLKYVPLTVATAGTSQGKHREGRVEHGFAKIRAALTTQKTGCYFK